MQGARLHWKDGCWQPASRSPEVVQRFAHDAAPWRMLQAPANLDAAAAFVVFDTVPSYEPIAAGQSLAGEVSGGAPFHEGATAPRRGVAPRARAAP